MDQALVRRRTLVLLATLLVGTTLAVFWRVGSHPFITLDDDAYILDNAFVRRGLTLEGLRWALTTGAASNWHPLAWLSHMLDVQLFALDAGAHHLTSLVLHAASSVALLLLLESMTRAAWPSALTAMLFAIHPLHVESVAWVAERKDVLSTLLGFLTVGAWLAWTRRGGAWRYGLALGLYALGLMAKPMLVTLPGLLLLLDVWPLRRLDRLGASAATPLGRLLVEKAPFLLLAVSSSAMTLWAQHRAHSMAGLDVLSLGERLGHSAIAYTSYLGQALWPAHLSVYYPLRPALPWQVARATVLLLAVTGLCLWQLLRRPYLLVGWLWFLGTLVPVIGLVQVGDQAMADRYTYLPLVGPFAAAAWAGLDAWHRWRPARPALLAAALLLPGALAVAAWSRVDAWRSSEALFTEALAEGESWMAHTSLGKAALAGGRTEEAVVQFRRAVELRPRSPVTLTNLAAAAGRAGANAEAAALAAQAVGIEPGYEAGWYNLGVARRAQGQAAEAAAALERAVHLDPESPWSRFELGLALLESQRFREAEPVLRAALALRPESVEARSALGVALAQQGRLDEAITTFGEALRLAPERTELRENLEAARRARRAP